MSLIFCVFLLTLLVVTAIAIVRAQDLFVAVMLFGIFSFMMASVFFLLDAADVALTEAAIGAGVSTVFMLGALALLTRKERASRGPRWVAIGVGVLTAIILIYASFDQPRFGDPNAPAHQHVAPWYLAESLALTGMPNVVTAILASFRGYDTLGELFVIFTAGIGVLFILAAPPPAGASAHFVEPRGLDHHLIPRVVGRLLIPFIVLFGLYIQFHGDFGPGGGFQAGALIAAGLILHALLEGEDAALRTVRTKTLTSMAAAGGLLFTGVGIASMLLGGTLLDYSVLRPDPLVGQHLGIVLVELGVGLTVTSVMLMIFHAFAARGHQS